MEDQYREHFKNHQDEESRKEEEGGDAVNIPKNMKMQEKTTNALNPDSVVTVLSLPSSSSETSHGATLKTFHSVSLGDNPVVFPIHLQMAEQTTPLVSKTEATPYFVLSQGPTFLSAVQDQEALQHLNTQLHLRMAPFPTVSLQNTLCENSRMSYYQTLPDQRLTTIAEEHKIPSLLHGHRLALLLQDSLPSQNPCSSTAYQVTSPTDLFTSSLISPHPTLPHSISSVLSPLFPPVTLLVPYPFVVPLPVPLPIPIPIPIPHSGSETRAFFHPRAAGKMSKSTQTYTEEFPRPIHLHDHNFDHPVPCLSALSSLEEDVLDLSVKTNSTHTKQEVLGRVLQDTVLDLSITRVKTPSIQSCRGREPQSHQHYCKDITLSPSHKKERHPLSVEALHPVEWSVKLGCESFNDPTVLDLNRHKWVMDGGCGKSGTETKFGSRNSAVSPSQGAKDMMTVPLCEKLKDLARISMKNFSSKTDINEVTMLQQCNSTLPNSQGDWPAFSAPGSHTLKNQVVKLKKVSTQDMHVLTSKKQRLSSYSSHK